MTDLIERLRGHVETLRGVASGVYSDDIAEAVRALERASTEGEIAELRNGELLAENQIMYRALDRISRSVAGSPHLVKLAREALERVSGRQSHG